MAEATSISIGMLPTRVDGCDWTYYVNPAAKTGEMPCKRDLAARETTTFWVPETDIPEDRPDDAAIHVAFRAFRPRVEVGFAFSIDSMTLDERPLAPASGLGFWVGVLLTDEIVELLNSNGYFALRVGMAPPPPVSVWIA